MCCFRHSRRFANSPDYPDSTGNQTCFRDCCFGSFIIGSIAAIVGGIILIVIGGAGYWTAESDRVNKGTSYEDLVSTYPNAWLTNSSFLPLATAQDSGVNSNASNPSRMVQQTSIVTPLNMARIQSDDDDDDDDHRRGIVQPHPTILLSTTVRWNPFENSTSSASGGSFNLVQTQTNIELVLYGNPSDRSQATDTLNIAIPTSKTVLSPVDCNEKACASDCQNAGERVCNRLSLQRYCESEYGPGSTYAGDSECERSETCGVCQHVKLLSTVCAVVSSTSTPNHYVFDRSMESCYYPFTASSQQYFGSFVTASSSSPTPSTLTVQLRYMNDPFIFLQRVTQGTMDIPIPGGEHIRGPMIVGGIGLALVLTFGIALCCVFGPRCCCRRGHQFQYHDDRTAQNGQINEIALQPVVSNIAPQPTQQQGVFVAEGRIVNMNGGIPRATFSSPAPVIISNYDQTTGPRNEGYQPALNTLPAARTNGAFGEEETMPGVPMKQQPY